MQCHELSNAQIDPGKEGIWSGSLSIENLPFLDSYEDHFQTPSFPISTNKVTK